MSGARRVYLVRHGSVSYFDDHGRPLDPRHVPLNPQGISQARACAELLAEAPLSRIVCSGLPRTVQTADIIRGMRPLVVEIEPELKEIRAGRFREVPDALRFREIAHAYAQAPQPGAQFIGGERWDHFNGRVVAAFARQCQVQQDGDLLLVVHDAVIRVILAHVCGAGLGALRAFEQDPAGLSILDRQELVDGTHNYVLRAVNLAAYDLLRLTQRDTVMERIWHSYQAEA